MSWLYRYEPNICIKYIWQQTTLLFSVSLHNIILLCMPLFTVRQYYSQLRYTSYSRTRLTGLLFISVILTMMLVIGLTIPAQAGIRLNQTRVIIQENTKTQSSTKATARITNTGEEAYLVKASVLKTTDDTPSTPVNQQPFIVTPPLFRLDANSEQAVLIIKQHQGNLPKDRESVFYLSFLAIPSSAPAEEGMSRVSLGLQSIIKLFYRPHGLPLAADEAAGLLTFTQTKQGLQVNNPTPYHVTLTLLKVADTAIDVRNQGAMINPFDSKVFTLAQSASKSTTTPKNRQISWQALTDYGGESRLYQAQWPSDQ